jgi:integrase
MTDIRKRTGPAGVSYQVRYKDAGGAYRYKSFPTLKAAKAFTGRIGAEVADGRHIHERDSITVDKALDAWIETVETVGRHGREPVSPATVRKYRERAKNHIRPLLGDVLLAQLTTPRVVEFRDELLKRCARPTAKKCLTDLRSALAEARLRGQMVLNPAADVSIVDSNRRQRRPEIPTIREMQAIERALRQRRDDRDWQRFYAMLTTLRWSGARPSEVRALAETGLHPNRGQVRVIQGADEDGLIGAPKTANAYRMIDAPELLFDVLAEWLMIRQPPSKNPHALVFPTRNGAPVSLSNLTARAWSAVLEDAGLKGRYPLYSLRHYRISERLAAGENIHVVSEQAGHADAGFTLRVYGHVLREGLR